LSPISASATVPVEIAAVSNGTVDWETSISRLRGRAIEG
jgi:hypothetical protein